MSESDLSYFDDIENFEMRCRSALLQPQRGEANRLVVDMGSPDWIHLVKAIKELDKDFDGALVEALVSELRKPG